MGLQLTGGRRKVPEGPKISSERDLGFWATSFLAGLIPLLFTRRALLSLHLTLLGVFDAFALPTLIDPASTIYECPISGGGNPDDFHGYFIYYSFGYLVFLAVFYITLIIDVLARTMWPHK